MRLPWSAIRRAACFGAVVVLLGTATGCGGKGNVSGTVTGPDGKPLPLGKISFTPSSGPPGVSADIEDGKYTAENVGTGENKVAVETAYIKTESLPMLKNTNPESMATHGTGGGGPVPKDMPAEAVAGMAAINKSRDEGIQKAKDNMAKYREIPEKFTDPKTSGLSLTVKSGANTFPVDLSK
ncbi:MAG TPA: hypothetical protein DDY78_02585 [Planctomycetales bacterium]|jgi:hypothetical protein|nr:hypothetical protein [Planctomycetales bacterium]